MSMSIKCEQYGPVCVVEVSGDLIAENVAAVRAQVEERLATRSTANFVVDFSKSGFVDSEGLETLLWMKRKCEELFGQVRLVHLDDHCRKILEITRLEHRFQCHADLAGALKTMR